MPVLGHIVAKHGEACVHNFALTGAAGYVAPRHLKAIYDTGNRLIAALDPHDSVGILDRYAFDVRFFTEFERFDRHLEKLRRGPADGRVHYVSVCSPNYLHDAHVRTALRAGAHAICEKPLVINPWNLDALQNLERETGRQVFSVLQLRLHPVLQSLREELLVQNVVHEVCLTYITARGTWYFSSWKGREEHSGGVVANIGVHLFDLLIWLFGNVSRSEVHLRDSGRASGYLELQRARVRWFLSVDNTDLPFPSIPGTQATMRSITLDGKELEFTDGFVDLHTQVYQAVMNGNGLGIDEARSSIELAHRIRTSDIVRPTGAAHPKLTGSPSVG